MEYQEKLEWATNLAENNIEPVDDGSYGDGDFYNFLVRNWDFGGTEEDADDILCLMCK